MSESSSIVILGGGLTGLSAAYHLGARRPVVIEKEHEPGGLARTRVEEGFTFDCTGHLLHLRDESVKSLIGRMLPDAFARHDRRAQIFSKGTYTAFPFQANLFGLPPAVVKECVEGFVEALVRREREGEPDLARLTFREWVGKVFGRGIADHFMIPYNSKLWRTDLDEVECGWVSWSIPRPSLREILDGAFGQTVRGLGYNPTFLYPRRSGIRVLPDALARGCADLRLGSTVARVDAAARTVHLEGGATLAYESLISTLPLDHLLAITSGLPAELPAAGRRLRAVRVLNIGLGIDRAPLSGAHWIYFPEADYSFYRVGFPGNLSPSLVPPGCSSLYVERSLLRTEPFDAEAVVERAVADLRRAGILWRADRIVHSRVQVLDPAYVIYDRFRADTLPLIFRTLEAAGILSAGRFGAWEYNSMEGAIRAGMDLAARLASPRPGEPRAARAAASR